MSQLKQNTNHKITIKQSECTEENEIKVEGEKLLQEVLSN